MSEVEKTSRKGHKRSTHAVLSDMPDMHRWWVPQLPVKTPTFGPRRTFRARGVQFRSGDPMERLRWARWAVAVLSLTMPSLFLMRVDGIQKIYKQLSWNPRAEAEKQIARGHTIEAIGPLRAALAMQPDSPDLLRQLAKAVSTTSPAEARRCFNRLDRLGLTTDEDRAAHATLLASLHDFTGAKAVLARATPAAKTSPSHDRAWLAIWRESGDFKAACSKLDNLATANQLDVDTCLSLADAASQRSIDITITERIEQHLIKTLSQSMSNGKANDVLARASRVASLPWRSTVARSQAAQILRNLPGSPAEYRMAAVRLGFPANLDGKDRQALRQAWLDEITWNGGLSAEDKDRVALYLQDQHEHELVAELISAPESLSESTLYVRRISSLIELGRWRDIGSMASSMGAPTLPSSRLFISAAATLFKPSPQSCMAERLLKDAYIESRDEKNSATCFAIGCAALDHRLPILASNAFASALDFSKDRRNLMENVINNSRQSPLTVTQLLRALEGTDTTHDDSVQNQLIYLNLLAGHDVESMSAVIHARRAQHPDDVYLRFLESFALHQRGQFTQAAQLLVPLPKYRWHQGEAAVIASIIASAGNFDRSSSLLGQISTEGLFAEERSLVAPWQQRLASDSTIVGNFEKPDDK